MRNVILVTTCALPLATACNIPMPKGLSHGDDTAHAGQVDTNSGGDDTGAPEQTSHSGDTSSARDSADSADAMETSDTTDPADSTDTVVADDTAGPADTTDTGDTTEYFDMGDADAAMPLGHYDVGNDLDAGDINGDDKAELFVLENDGYRDTTYGYVVPGPTAMASTTMSSSFDGLIELKDDIEAAGSFSDAWRFGPVGDIDGDGLSDVAFPQPTPEEGPFVFSGATLSTDRFTDGYAYTSEADLTVEGSDSGWWFLSADGAPATEGILQIGGWDADSTTIFLFPLPVEGMTLDLEDASATITSSQYVDQMKEIDVDGDGVPELMGIVSGWSLEASDPMEVYLYDLPADGSTITDADMRAMIEDPSAGVPADSYELLLPGDLDGDGLDDLVAIHNCPLYTDFIGCFGKVVGTTSLSSLSGTVALDSVAGWTIYGLEYYSHLGDDSALVPDVDGDGLPELMAHSDWGATSDSGDSDHVFLSSLWSGGGTLDESDAARSYLSETADDTNAQVASADLDGDDNPELLIGYSVWDRGGGAYIFSW